MSEPQHRANDADRERTLTALREGYGAGALALDELVERVERALVSTTTRELDVLSSDLTSPRPPAPARRTIVGAFGTNKIRGRWRISGRTRILALFGSCKVDLADAQLEAPDADVVELETVALFGTIKLGVPRGVCVEVDGVPIFGSHKVTVSGRPLPGLPTVRITARTLFGTLKVR